jgi:hypothetical protein
MTEPQGPARRAARVLARLLLAWLLAGALVLAWWMLRPNRAEVDHGIVLESWPVVSDAMHNSNTDLAWWRGHFYLAHDRRPYHFASPDAEIWLHRSLDARRWERVASFRIPGNDLRDPHLAVIRDRLHLYVLPNRALEPRPHGTAVATSADGLAWSALEPIEPDGWLLWRPLTRDGVRWLAPAYVRGMGRAALFGSEDGRRWMELSTIHAGDGASETDAVLLPDGRVLATVRLELDAPPLGSRDAGTLIAAAGPPYTQWSRTRTSEARLDGPCLFVHDGRAYGIGRRDPDASAWGRRTGSILGRKRTAIFALTPERLAHLTDLPSAGDTSYAGCVVRAGELFASYYTSDPAGDPPWILGMLRRSQVRIARVDLRALAARADAALARKEAPSGR